MSDVKKFLDIWEKSLFQENNNKIKEILEKTDLILFFSCEDEIYATNENGRLIFAKLKDPKEDKTWKTDASFKAINLTRASKAEKIEKLFNTNNLKDIKIIDQDKVIKNLNSTTQSVVHNLKKVLNNEFER